ncbi:MAG TPA: polymer-forming cytoskeletal protein [Firmicutes bacterium]|nr:polymer-forming cytoskeletal protein [Bacillota bacterium]
MFGGRKQQVDLDRVDTIIGQETELKGTIKGAGTVRIDGAVEGDVVVKGDLIVSESGRLKADVCARHATVAGKIEGDVELSGRMEITPTGKIYGQIKVASLTVTEGGFLSGNCIMLDAEESANDSARKKHQRIPTQKEKQSKGK